MQRQGIDNHIFFTLRHLRNLALLPPIQVARSSSPAPPAGKPQEHKLSAQEIQTVPWEPARGPRLRYESRHHKQAEDIKRRSRQQAGRGIRGIMSSKPSHDMTGVLDQLRSGIEDVQVVISGPVASTTPATALTMFLISGGPLRGACRGGLLSRAHGAGGGCIGGAAGPAEAAPFWLTGPTWCLGASFLSMTQSRFSM